MRPVRVSEGGSVSNAISKYVDRRNTTSGGGGIDTANKWYPKRLNETITDDLSAYIERVTHPIDSFTVADPGSVVIAGVDVTAFYPAGRMCDIRDPNHTGGNDTLTVSRPYVVNTSVFAAGDTTINFSTTVAYYRQGGIVADVAGDSIISGGIFKCLVSGDYLVSASAECYGVHQTALRVVNITGFTYSATTGEVTGEGGTVFEAGLTAYIGSSSGRAIISKRVVSLVAGEYYELQQFVDDAQGTYTGWGYPRISLDMPSSYAYISIRRYTT